MRPASQCRAGLDHAGMLALLLAILCAAPAPSLQAAGMPLKEIGGAPITEPTTDPHDLSGMWVSSAGMMGADIPGTSQANDLPLGQSPLGDSWQAPVPVNASTNTLTNLLTAMAAQGISYATPHLTCRPNGVAGLTGPKFPVAIVQSPQGLYILMEEDRDVYHVGFNRQHPVPLKPSYNGDSIAAWEGNTLVVDTVGFNGTGMLDEAWHPVSNQAHLVQWYTKSADGRSIGIVSTLTDPTYYSEPLHMQARWNWAPGRRQLEYDCSEHPQDASAHYVYTVQRFRPACIAAWDPATESNRVSCDKALLPRGSKP